MEGLDWILRKREEATARHQQRRRLQRTPGLECEKGRSCENEWVPGLETAPHERQTARRQSGQCPLPPPPASWATVPARRDVAGVMAEKGFNGPRAWESRGEAMLSELLAAGQLGI